MAITLSTKDLGHHARMDEDSQNEHHPKGFIPATKGKYIVKDPTENLAYEFIPILPKALDHVDSSVAPPTEVDGDIYLLDTTGATLDVDTIVWQSGTTVRYTFNGTPDLSSISADDYMQVLLAAETSNNGIFIITTVNDGADWIEVTNADRTDGTDDEASDAPATGTVTHGDWDGAPQNGYVKFNGTTWDFIAPIEGVQCYDITCSCHRLFTGTIWQQQPGATIQTERGFNKAVVTTGTVITFPTAFPDANYSLPQPRCFDGEGNPVAVRITNKIAASFKAWPAINSNLDYVAVY